MALTPEEKELRRLKKLEKEQEKEAKRLAKEQEELRRLEGMREYEKEYELTCDYVCGIDEAGRGPLAGPVVAAAVILPKGMLIPYVNDSKKLTERRRELLYPEIMEKALAVGVGIVSPERIDEINILQATYEAMRQALSQLPVHPDVLLNDAVRIPGVDIPQVPIVKGDAKSISIACASVIAKVTRDRMMVEYDQLYPEYGFAGHKGYGSAAHMEALRQIGPCPIHRKTFIKGILGEN
ncbi:MAG: ribonuclease HII [Lachnospiraceae bacterium]|nr:ribonuclease HII [Lachnospiraceae bacterium]